MENDENHSSSELHHSEEHDMNILIHTTFRAGFSAGCSCSVLSSEQTTCPGAQITEQNPYQIPC